MCGDIILICAGNSPVNRRPLNHQSVLSYCHYMAHYQLKLRNKLANDVLQNLFSKLVFIMEPHFTTIVFCGHYNV